MKIIEWFINGSNNRRELGVQDERNRNDSCGRACDLS